MSDRDVGQRSPRDDATRRESGTERDRNPTERGKWISALIALVGLWMIAEGFLFDLTAAQLWNDAVIGLLLLAVGGYNYYRQANERFGSVGAASIAALIGLWIIVTPFVFGDGFAAGATGAAFGAWNDLLAGLITFALGAYSAYKFRNWQETPRAAA
ncbi:SPW repeat domain-containing protein [Halobellus sp. GM3]|uniref:SPW repeat domain-containing protein n=1 Tax=Halobellus sp. GM3 TaxID=3458410 RepID=UPI00403D997F